jgi:hypothetical protein
LIAPPNVPAEFALVTGAGLATFKELQTFYSYEDLLDMTEVLITQRYNEWAALEGGRRKNVR